MRKRHGVRASWGLWVLLLALCLPLVGMGKATGGGYLAVFDPAAEPGGNLRLLSLARLSAAPGPRLAELDGRSDWQLVYLDDLGEVIGDLAVPDPGAPLRGAAGAPLPLTLRFADWPGAVLVEVRNASRTLVAEIPLDAAAREAAARAATRAKSLRPLEPASRPRNVAQEARSSADARKALHRQMAAAARVERGRDCAASDGLWTPPELIRSTQGCGPDEGLSLPAIGPTQPGPPVDRSHGVARPKMAGLQREAVRPRNATVLLEGRVRFAPGTVPPEEGLGVIVYGANGNPDEFVYVDGTPEPPDFTFSLQVQAGSPIRISVPRPPAPFLPETLEVAAVQAGTAYDLTLQRGHVLSGRMLLPQGVDPPESGNGMYFFLFATDAAGVEQPVRTVSSFLPDFKYSVGIGAGWSVRIFVPPSTPLVSSRLELESVNADMVRDIALERGVVVSGRVAPPRGGAAPGGEIYMHLTGSDGNTFHTLTAPDYRYEFLARAGSMPTALLTPPAPYLGDEIEFGLLATDLVRDITLRRGVSLTHRLRSSGVLPSSISWQLLDLVSGQVRTEYMSVSGDFVMAVPPRGAVVEVHADGFRASQGVTPGGGNNQATRFDLEPLNGTPNVILELLRPDDYALDSARVEIWRNGRFFTSVLSDNAGIARLDLADGNYRVKVWPDNEERASYYVGTHTPLFADPAIDVPLVVAGQTEMTLRLDATKWLTMAFATPEEAAWPGCYGGHGRLELLRSGQVVARGPFHYLGNDLSRDHMLITGPGNYTLRYQMPGGVSYTSDPFTARDGGRITLHRDGDAPQNLWTGTLRDHQGNPVPNRSITVSDELGIITQPVEWCPIATDANGRFRLPICEGCVFEFPASAGSPAQRRIVRIDGPVTGSRNEDIRLGRPLAFAPLASEGVSRVFGRADAPIKLVFLAEGYTAERETFTDSNGNGIWDGVQLVDRNGNGVYDGGEAYALYGNATDPQEGQDPRSLSEVIQDRNGDGVLSLNDQALFERNVQDYLRGLFSSHQFSSYRNAYQASAVMTYSRQAGMDHGDGWQRDTAFGAYYDRGLIGVDYDLASLAAAEASPDHTVVVVMINQPVPYGRVNSFILAGGGVLASGINGNVAAHEFGHNPGRLADEYAEYSGTYTGLSPLSFANTTRFVDRNKVAWGESVPEHQDGRPSRPWMSATGLYEGSSYYPSGMYRPSPSSMMRYDDSLLFNEPSVRQLGLVHARALMGRDGLLSIDPDSVGCRGYRVSWNTAPIGITRVELRTDGPEGTVIASGVATGSASLKPYGGDLYLTDALTGAVLDIEAEPMLRCTQSTPAAPRPVAPPVIGLPPASPAPRTGPPRKPAADAARSRRAPAIELIH